MFERLHGEDEESEGECDGVGWFDLGRVENPGTGDVEDEGSGTGLFVVDATSAARRDTMTFG